jgi:hypothetical protein
MVAAAKGRENEPITNLGSAALVQALERAFT